MSEEKTEPIEVIPAWQAYGRIGYWFAAEVVAALSAFRNYSSHNHGWMILSIVFTLWSAFVLKIYLDKWRTKLCLGGAGSSLVFSRSAAVVASTCCD